MSYQLGRTRGGVRRGFKRSWSDDPYHHCHPVRTEWSPSRTAVRAEKAEIRQSFHPAIGRGANPELGVVVVA